MVAKMLTAVGVVVWFSGVVWGADAEGAADMPGECSAPRSELLVTPDLPVPQPGGPHGFSRAPRKMHFDSASGSLIKEYVLMPLCRDGVHTFYTIQYSISPGGRVLTVIKYRQQSPANERRISISRTTHTTTIPYEFHLGSRTLRFSVVGEQITGMEVLDENGNPAGIVD